MRISYLSTLFLSGLAIASPAPAIDRRVDAVSILTELFSTIQTYTGAINATLASLSPTSSILDKTAAITSVGEQLTSITAALKDSATSIKAATPGCSSKRSALALTTTDLTITSPHPEKRQIVAVGVLLALIIVEIFATITAAIAVLGLAGLLLFINPLTGALAVLILAVEVLVDALLIAVIVLLDTLLTGLAIGIGGL